LFSKIIHIAIPILLASTGVIAMSLLSHFIDNGQFPVWSISGYPVVNITFSLQMVMLAVSLVVLLVMRAYNKTQFKLFFRWSGASPAKDDEWRSFGPVIAIAFTAGTILFVSAGVRAQNGTINNSFFQLLPLVLLFAATNAWSEELFTRFVIVAGLNGKINPVAICWISAIIFGGPHFFGTPSGFFGVLMAGLLGWFLARSVIDTKGMGWALFIHFLQDLVIFGAGAMVLAGKS
jgi:membrane protease YdiL (CAAX protease family)